MLDALKRLFVRENPEADAESEPENDEPDAPSVEQPEVSKNLQRSFDTAEILAEGVLEHLRKQPRTIENDRDIKTQERYLEMLRQGTVEEKISVATIVLGEKYKLLSARLDAFEKGNERVKVEVLKDAWKRETVMNLVQSNASVKETRDDLESIAEQLAALHNRA